LIEVFITIGLVFAASSLVSALVRTPTRWKHVESEGIIEQVSFLGTFLSIFFIFLCSLAAFLKLRANKTEANANPRNKFVDDVQDKRKRFNAQIRVCLGIALGSLISNCLSQNRIANSEHYVSSLT